jgi:hypothetical protein
MEVTANILPEQYEAAFNSQDRMRREREARDALMDSLSVPKRMSAEEILSLYPSLKDHEREKVMSILSNPAFDGLPIDWVDENSGHTYSCNGPISEHGVLYDLVPRVIGDYIRDTEMLGCKSTHLVCTIHKVEKTGDLFLYYKTIPTPNV